MNVLVSNGSNQFHLGPLAAELARRRILLGVIVSGWPTRVTRIIARPFYNYPAVNRFLNRSEDIPVDLQFICNVSEIIFQIGIRIRRFSEMAEQRFNIAAFWWYSQYAKILLKRKSAVAATGIYHYRACYGLTSVSVAKKTGFATLCDHSIAHPGVLQHMIENDGAWPIAAARPDVIKSPLQRMMYRDIGQAEWLLVNSDFVKKTCVFSGFPADKIRVVYLGVDEKFFKSIPEFDADQVRKRSGSRILFAGGVQRRKGIATLAKAGLKLGAGVKFNVVGGAGSEIQFLDGVVDWLKSENVNCLGVVPRSELPHHMVRSSIFVFPSYCEGSARVIFEAMACGCYIITTENSGSIVEDGVHGIIVPVGNVDALVDAINFALNNPITVAVAGWRNACLIRDRYRQSHYADKVIDVYREVLN